LAPGKEEKAIAKASRLLLNNPPEQMQIIRRNSIDPMPVDVSRHRCPKCFPYVRLESPFDAVGKFLGIIRCNKDTTVADCLGQATGFRGDHRTASGDGFQSDNPKGFVSGRNEEEFGAPVLHG
jgi:hypothetical protein